MAKRIQPVKTPEDLKAGLDQACEALEAGLLVAFPTESFYGLAADPQLEPAVRGLFQAKGRSPDRPVLLLLPSRGRVSECAARIPAVARALMDRFWPGPLTLVFEAAPSVNPLLTAGTGTIGLRLSSHPVATALARSWDGPITGTSANRSGRPPACAADEVDAGLGPEVACILDGGATAGGGGSTILDVTVEPPAVLREGQISREALGAFLEGVAPG